MSEIDRRSVILGGTAGAMILTITGSSAADIAEQASEYLGTGWQPIETAPKDGTEIFLYIPPSKGWKSCVFSGYWHDTETHIPAGTKTYMYGKLVKEVSESAKHSWKAWFASGYPGSDPQPIYWMPIPRPPLIA